MQKLQLSVAISNNRKISYQVIMLIENVSHEKNCIIPYIVWNHKKISISYEHIYGASYENAIHQIQNNYYLRIRWE